MSQLVALCSDIMEPAHRYPRTDSFWPLDQGARTCRALLKALEEAELFAQDLPNYSGHEEHRPGPGRPVGVHQGVWGQGEAALCPEACTGATYGGEDMSTVHLCPRPSPQGGTDTGQSPLQCC